MLVALECPGCQALYDPNPVKVHVCGHTLCTKCAWVATSTSRAPCCNTPLQPRDLQPDRSVGHLVAAVAALSARVTPRIALTALESNAQAAAEHAFEALGVKQAQPRIATHVVTRVHAPSREVARRTRAVHYALARDVPIVDVTWLLACAEREQWLPARPYEAARAVRDDGDGDVPVFHNVVAFVDVPDPLGAEVADWLSLAGATVLKPQQQIPNSARIVVRIVPDIADENEEVEHKFECESNTDMQVVLQDIAWVSDCLVSQKCPPSVEYLETMSTETQNLTLAQALGDEDG